VKSITAIVDGVLVTLNKPETSAEFKEGARLSASLDPNEGYLFDFGGPSRSLVFENSGVPYDLTILFFEHVINASAVVSEVRHLVADSSVPVSSSYVHTKAIELRTDFCQAHKIGSGSIITFSDSEERDG
jgi:uncharacterized membrane protein (UPF0127 family)